MANFNLFNNAPDRSITNTIELITPEKAKYELKTSNTHNRPLSETLVRKYSEQMRAGKWKVNTTEPISFTPEGVLVDGQHRLAAVVYSNVAVPMTINRNAEESDFEVLNTGKKRSMSDVFAIYGVKNYTRVSAIIWYFLQLKKNGVCAPLRRNNSCASTDLLAEYWADREFWDKVTTFSVNLYSAGNKIVNGQIVGGLYAYIVKVMHYDYEMAEKFFREIDSGNSEYLSVVRMHGDIVKSQISNSKRMTKLYLVKSLVKTWNYVASNNKAVGKRLGENEEVMFK